MADESLIESFKKYSGLGNTKNRVGEFLIALKKAGVEVTSQKGNARILKKEGTSVGVLIHEYTPLDHKGPPFWGIAKSQVERMRQEHPSNWGLSCFAVKKPLNMAFGYTVNTLRPS